MMSSAAGIASPSEAPAKSPRQKARSTQKKKTCPALSALILNAVSTERGSVSLPALKKALKGAGYDVTKNNTRILTCIRRLVGNKCLLKTKGTGASGSFKKAPAPQKKVAKKKVVKKVTAAGTPAAKKSPKKKRKAKSPKKVKKATVPKAKKAKSPKKATAAKAKAKKAKSPKKPKLVSTRTRSAVKK